jgi:Kef-type K+ transport system membrane component KefB
LFTVGVELDPALLRGRGRIAVATSWASIVLPFALGAGLAAAMYGEVCPPAIPRTAFVPFLGLAMSVTAFPVLARILAERGLTKTPLGAVALACAAVDDVSAWSMLAAVVVVARGGGAGHLWITIAGSVAYVVVMLTVVRRVVRPLAERHRRAGRLTAGVALAVGVVAAASAWTTASLGIHALFGAFLAGAVMPKDERFVADLHATVGGVATVLLPLFFASTGLRTEIGLLQSARLWAWAALVLVAAVAGKWGGSMLAARAGGLGWREAGTLGVLMNTRGLMELVILTVGLEVGAIPPAVFAMMVLMALATTVMTAPLLDRLHPAVVAHTPPPESRSTRSMYGGKATSDWPPST